MTVPPLDDLPRATLLPGRLLRDLLAVVLVLVGLVGLGVVAWKIDPLVLAGYLATISLAAGLVLAADR